MGPAEEDPTATLQLSPHSRAEAQGETQSRGEGTEHPRDNITSQGVGGKREPSGAGDRTPTAGGTPRGTSSHAFTSTCRAEPTTPLSPGGRGSAPEERTPRPLGATEGCAFLMATGGETQRSGPAQPLHPAPPPTAPEKRLSVRTEANRDAVPFSPLKPVFLLSGGKQLLLPGRHRGTPGSAPIRRDAALLLLPRASRGRARPRWLPPRSSSGAAVLLFLPVPAGVPVAPRFPPPAPRPSRSRRVPALPAAPRHRRPRGVRSANGRGSGEAAEKAAGTAPQSGRSPAWGHRARSTARPGWDAWVGVRGLRNAGMRAGLSAAVRGNPEGERPNPSRAVTTLRCQGAGLRWDAAGRDPQSAAFCPEQRFRPRCGAKERRDGSPPFPCTNAALPTASAPAQELPGVPEAQQALGRAPPRSHRLGTRRRAPSVRRTDFGPRQRPHRVHPHRGLREPDGPRPLRGRLQRSALPAPLPLPPFPRSARAVYLPPPLLPEGAPRPPAAPPIRDPPREGSPRTDAAARTDGTDRTGLRRSLPPSRTPGLGPGPGRRPLPLPLPPPPVVGSLGRGVRHGAPRPRCGPGGVRAALGSSRSDPPLPPVTGAAPLVAAAPRPPRVPLPPGPQRRYLRGGPLRRAGPGPGPSVHGGAGAAGLRGWPRSGGKRRGQEGGGDARRVRGEGEGAALRLPGAELAAAGPRTARRVASRVGTVPHGPAIETPPRGWAAHATPGPHRCSSAVRPQRDCRPRCFPPPPPFPPTTRLCGAASCGSGWARGRWGEAAPLTHPRRCGVRAEPPGAAAAPSVSPTPGGPPGPRSRGAPEPPLLCLGGPPGNIRPPDNIWSGGAPI